MKERPKGAALAAFVIGLAFGLVVLGWWLLPVQWTGARLRHLSAADQEFFVGVVADLYAQKGDAAYVRRALGGWGGEVLACQMAIGAADSLEFQKLRAIANVITGQGCQGVRAEFSPEPGRQTAGVIALVVMLSLLWLWLVWDILVVYRRRSALVSRGASSLALPIPEGEVADNRAVVAPRHLGRRERRRQRAAATWRRFRDAWAVFVQNRIAVIGVALLVIFGLFPILHVMLRATAWDSKEYDPIYGFEMDSVPHPAPPSWLPADWLEPDDVHRFDLNRPSFEHLLGTDTLGRDVLSVLMASTVNTFIVGITAALSTAIIGVTIGALSAYYRGVVDGIFTHISDAFLLLPPPIFMIVIGIFLQTQRTTILEMIYESVTGNGFGDILEIFVQPFEFGLIYGIIAGAGGAAIVLRSHGLKVMSLSFVEASRVSGAGPRHIIWRHLVPHMLPLAAIYMMVIVTGAVVADGFLAFFGLNPNPLNWGTMIYNAFTYRVLNYVTPWSALIAPAIAISLFTAAFYMVSRGLHQVVEPRLREGFTKVS